MAHVITKEILHYFAHQQNVEIMDLGKGLNIELLRSLQRETNTPFRKVSELTVRLSPDTVRPLLQLLQPLVITQLKLELEGGATLFCEAVAALPNLRSLDIVFCSTKILRPPEILALCPLNSLLRRLVFRALNRLSFNSISALSRSCKMLMGCEVIGNLDLQLLSSLEEPAFPELVELQLDQAVPATVEQFIDPATMVGWIVRQMPKLNDLMFASDDALSLDILQTLRARCETEENVSIVSPHYENR